MAINKTATVTPAADRLPPRQAHHRLRVPRDQHRQRRPDLAGRQRPQPGRGDLPDPGLPGLAPGSSETCRADETHTVTQADLDAGEVTDTATATGTDTTGATTNPSPPSTATVPTVPAAPTVTIDKIADASTGDTHSLTVGETIAYAYLVTNTGNVDLTSLAVNDPTLGAVTCPTLIWPGLAPAASETCTADETHTVTQADVDAGEVSDTATAVGIDTAGDAPPTSAPSTDVIPQPATPLVAIDKTAKVAPAADQAAAKAGDSISYSYTVTNIGNVDLASWPSTTHPRRGDLPDPRLAWSGPGSVGVLHRGRDRHRDPGRRRRRHGHRYRHRRRHRHRW